MAQSPDLGGSTAPNTNPGGGGESIASQLQKAKRNRQAVQLGVSALVGGASFFVANKKMATNRAILVGLVLAVVAYYAAQRALPAATAQNYGV